MRLVWSEEFAGPELRWTREVAGHGFGNGELQYYTSRPENAYIQDSHLVIVARRERFIGPDGLSRDYTSARLNTSGLFSMLYGRLEARIQLPTGQGIWPAFWMLGQDLDTAGWPDCGEIDILESLGHEPSTVHAAVHGPGYSGEKGLSGSLSRREPLCHDFHLFGVQWSREAVQFSLDQQVYHTVTRHDLPRGTRWVFDHPFFIVLNVAVGGAWPGPPDPSTRFPQRMLVDYVRAYQP